MPKKLCFRCFCDFGTQCFSDTGVAETFRVHSRYNQLIDKTYNIRVCIPRTLCKG
jgi:hypothetical protein